MTDQTTIAFVLDYPSEAAKELDRLRRLNARMLQALRDVAENTVSLRFRSMVYAAIGAAEAK